MARGRRWAPKSFLTCRQLWHWHLGDGSSRGNRRNRNSAGRGGIPAKDIHTILHSLNASFQLWTCESSFLMFLQRRAPTDALQDFSRFRTWILRGNQTQAGKAGLKEHQMIHEARALLTKPLGSSSKRKSTSLLSHQGKVGVGEKTWKNKTHAYRKNYSCRRVTFTDPLKGDLISLILFNEIFTVEAHESPRECKEGIGEGHEIPSLGGQFRSALRTFIVLSNGSPSPSEFESNIRNQIKLFWPMAFYNRFEAHLRSSWKIEDDHHVSTHGTSKPQAHHRCSCLVRGWDVWSMEQSQKLAYRLYMVSLLMACSKKRNNYLFVMPLCRHALWNAIGVSKWVSRVLDTRCMSPFCQRPWDLAHGHQHVFWIISLTFAET